MIGADPKFPTHDAAGSLPSRIILGRIGLRCLEASRRRLFALALLAPLSLMLAHCGKAPSADALAANAQISPAGDTFEDRFPAPSFRDRLPTAQESFGQKLAQDFAISRQPQGPAAPASYQVA